MILDYSQQIKYIRFMLKAIIQISFVFVINSVFGQLNFTIDGLNYSTLSNTTVKIKSGTFSDNLTIPSSVTYNGLSFMVTSIENTFAAGSSITNVTIPTTVNSIGGQAFAGCTKLTSVTIPSSVTSIGTGVFRGSTAEIIVEQSNPNYSSYDGVLYNKSQSILLQCTNYHKGNFQIPTSVTLISNAAFAYCVLTSVYIPSSVTTIEMSAFFRCYNLNSIFVYSIFPTNIDNYVFGEVNKSTCTLNVPVGSKAFYQLANGWKDFTNIIEMTTTVIANSLNSNNKIKVYGSENSIVIDGTSREDEVTVSTVNGNHIQTIRSNGEKFNIPLPRNTVYLVKTKEKTFKVVL